MIRYHLTVKFHNAETDAFDTDDYCYWIDTDKNIVVGDYIILKDDVNWDALKIVKVVKAVVFEAGMTGLPKAKTKALIGFAEVGDYFKEKEKKRRAKEIRKELAERFKEAEKMALYRELAKTDDTMKALLAELDSLGTNTEDDEDEEEDMF